MALDKQRILSELGSVMNQLQSADCGCMGKLFSGSGQGSSGQGSPGQAMGSPLPTCGGCRRGCCQGHGHCGYGAPYAGDAGAMGRPCMGHCNPPKLYADTYGYLNQNLMQPVVKEVYDDLRSITPANTIGNNPLANQMGLGNGPMAGGGTGNPTAMQNMGGMSGGGIGNPNAMQNMGGMPGGYMGNQNGMQNMGGMPADDMSNPNTMQNMGGMPNGAMGNSSAMQRMNGMSAGNAMENPNNEQMSGGGMGAQIVNMMMSGGGGKASNMPAQGRPVTEPMLIDAPHSPHGQVGVTPLNSPVGKNPGQFGAGNMGMSSMGQVDPNATRMGQGNPTAQMLNPPTQYVTQDNMYTVGNAQANPTLTGNMAQNVNPGSQQPVRAAPSNPYGQHSQGVTKFNQMFPGVMQGGDLGFDPMALAIQMNPANQKRAAMETIEKLMSGKPGALGNTGMTHAVGGTNVSQSNQLQQNQNQTSVNQMGNQQIAPSQQHLAPANQLTNQQMLQGQQEIANPHTGAISQPNQQVYSLTGAPTLNQQQMQGKQPQQQMVDPNTGAVINSPSGYEGMTEDPHASMQQSAPPTETPPPPAQEMYKEPIFPADTSRNPPTYHVKTQRNLQYNTLGQPVEMLPGSYYHVQEPSLPQTLSPQHIQSKPVGNLGRLGVKSTVSKTSLMGNRPLGQTPSRSQLQHVYHQYKGSQSYTQQNIRAPAQSGTHSDGKLNSVPAITAPAMQIPVEKVGGDTSANNQINDQLSNRVEVKGQIGDVPATNKPHGDVPMEKPAPQRHARLRNGLQDMTYTAYPSNAAWTFHGEYYPPGAMASFYRGGNRRK